MLHPDRYLCCQNNILTLQSDTHPYPPSGQSAKHTRDMESSERKPSQKKRVTVVASSYPKFVFYSGINLSSTQSSNLDKNNGRQFIRYFKTLRR